MMPFAPEDRVQVYAKLAFLSPTMNIKWSPAFRMLESARTAGDLEHGPRLVEASSGNMALSLAMQCRAFGIPGLTAIVPADIAFVKKELLHLCGVDFIFSNEIPGDLSAIQRAKVIGQEVGRVNLAQYENPANPAAHEAWTAPELLEQTEGRISVFCAGLGSTGTLVGARNAFAARSPAVQIVGCLCAPGNAVPGVRSEERLAEIKFNWRTRIHHIEVGTRESYKASLKLIREGILAGPSSGFSWVGLLRFLEEARKTPRSWDSLRNSNGDIVAVFICGDTPHLYVDKYSTILDPADLSV
jgi:cysteine synthase